MLQALVDHMAIPAQFQWMQGVTNFMEMLGFEHVRIAGDDKEGWRAHFYQPVGQPDATQLQVTFNLRARGMIPTIADVHPGLRVPSLQVAMDEIFQWAEENMFNKPVFTSAGPHKMFMLMIDLFPVQFELIEPE